MVKGSITCSVLLAAVNCAFNSSWVAAFTTTTSISNTPFGRYSFYHSARPSSQLSSLFTGKRRTNWIWEELPSNHVLEVIESLPRNSRNPQSKTATVADVATAAGVSLARAEKDCFLLAAALGASSKDQGNTFISVSNDGDLVFSFAAPVQEALERSSKAYRLRLYWKRHIQPKLASLLRVAFDASFYVSLTIITKIALWFAVLGVDAPCTDLTLSGANATLKYLSIAFLFICSGRFLPSAYSYVFNEGNPKEQIRHQQLRRAATYIRSQGGAVIDKQLVPFLLRSTLDLGSQVVSQFNGRPLVAENGDIVYVFQELLNTRDRGVLIGSTATASTCAHTLVYEQEHELPGDVTSLVFCQVSMILCATADVWLRRHLSHRPLRKHMNLPGKSLIHFLNRTIWPIGSFNRILTTRSARATIPFRFMVLFFLLPTIRYLYILWENNAMQERNEWRKGWQVAMASSPWRERYGQSTNAFRTKMKYVDVVDDMVYETTNETAATVQQEREHSHFPWFNGLWTHIKIQHPGSKPA
jgi:hypothetical protein